MKRIYKDGALVPQTKDDVLRNLSRAADVCKMTVAQLERVASFACDDHTRHNLTFVWRSRTQACATNGHRVVWLEGLPELEEDVFVATKHSVQADYLTFPMSVSPTGHDDPYPDAFQFYPTGERLATPFPGSKMAINPGYLLDALRGSTKEILTRLEFRVGAHDLPTAVVSRVLEGRVIETHVIMGMRED